MASISRQDGRWRARVTVEGKRVSKTFRTKAQAQAWASQVEQTGERYAAGMQTLADAMKRYAREVSPTKKGERWEVIRLKRLRGHQMASKRLSRLTADDIATWRDERLAAVSPGSVNRELNLLSAVFEQARREWRWIKTNPVRDVRRPKNPPPRDRRISEDEIDRICWALGYSGEVETKQHQVAVLFLLAIETGMRLGEMVGIDRSDVHPRHVRLNATKNGDPREVPLSVAARELIACAPFTVGRDVASTLFRKACRRAQVSDLTFHDTRHEAVSRLARKLDVLDLARMIGHRDPKSLMIYYNATADEIAGRLG